MIVLGERDVLELLGYAESRRHPLEILGYECSTRGAARFRLERPDVLPQVCRLIQGCLEESGAFPRGVGAVAPESGVTLERLAGGAVALHRSVEVGIGQEARVRIDFTSMREAILTLLRLVGDPAYLALPTS